MKKRSQAVAFGLVMSAIFIPLGFFFGFWIALAILPFLLLIDPHVRQVGIGMLLLVIAVPVYLGVYALLPGT